MNGEMTSGSVSRVVKVKNYYSFIAGYRTVYKFPKFTAFRAECHIGPLGCLKCRHKGPLGCLKRCHIGPLNCLKRFSGIVTSWHHMPLSIGDRTICQEA